MRWIRRTNLPPRIRNVHWCTSCTGHIKHNIWSFSVKNKLGIPQNCDPVIRKMHFSSDKQTRAPATQQSTTITHADINLSHVKFLLQIFHSLFSITRKSKVLFVAPQHRRASRNCCLGQNMMEYNHLKSALDPKILKKRKHAWSLALSPTKANMERWPHWTPRSINVRIRLSSLTLPIWREYHAEKRTEQFTKQLNSLQKKLE